jgi:hypothetical protein
VSLAAFDHPLDCWGLMETLGWTGDHDPWAINDEGVPAIEYALRNRQYGGLHAFVAMVWEGADLNGPTTQEPLLHAMLMLGVEDPDPDFAMIKSLACLMLDQGASSTARGFFDDNLLMRSLMGGIDLIEELHARGVDPGEVDRDDRNALFGILDGPRPRPDAARLVERLLLLGVDPDQPAQDGTLPREALVEAFPETFEAFAVFDARRLEQHLPPGGHRPVVRRM